MTTSIWLFLFVVLIFHGTESRVRELANSDLFADLSETEESLADISCTARSCSKRSDDMGPFWANRGKKDVKYYVPEHRYKEPRSYHGRSEFRQELNELPYVSEWRKPNDYASENNLWKILNDIMRVRDRRFLQKNIDIDSPFFAARGKKFNKV